MNFTFELLGGGGALVLLPHALGLQIGLLLLGRLRLFLRHGYMSMRGCGRARQVVDGGNWGANMGAEPRGASMHHVTNTAALSGCMRRGVPS